jgi:predicted nucleotidyltransferase
MQKALDTERLAERMSQRSEISLVYLFGSCVEGTTGPLSDVDLGILTEPDARVTQCRSELYAILTDTLKTGQIDIVMLRHAPVELAYSIIAQGRILYERDVAIRVEFEAMVMARYGDYLPVLRAQKCDILQGGAHATRVQRYRAALGRTERTLSQIRTAARQRTH